MTKKAEQFIKDYTKGCSNELTWGGYHEWLTPEQAQRACEIAVQESLEELKAWVCEHQETCLEEGDKNDNQFDYGCAAAYAAVLSKIKMCCE